MWNVSVVIPVHNAEKTLRRCLDSLTAQTMQDFQLVIVDDGSTDGSAAILEEYRSRAPERIKVHHQPQQGVTVTRQRGIALCDAPYIGFVDADDWVEPDYLESLYNLVSREGQDGRKKIACCAYEVEGLTKEAQKTAEGPGELSPGEAFRELLEIGLVTAFCWDKIFDARLLQDLDLPRESVIGEDLAIVAQAILRADVILRTDKVLYHYITTPASMTKLGYGPLHRHTAQHYLHLEETYSAAFPEYAATLHSYAERQLLAVLVAMSRNGNYDDEMGRMIQQRTRKVLWSFLRDRRVERSFKAAAVLTAVNWKWFCRIIRFVQNRN